MALSSLKPISKSVGRVSCSERGKQVSRHSGLPYCQSTNHCWSRRRTSRRGFTRDRGRAKP